MKKYSYRGKLYTIHELESHEDCIVSSYELRVNLWKYFMPVDLALITQRRPKRSKIYYEYKGQILSSFEISLLPECKFSYHKLRELLRKKNSDLYEILGQKREVEVILAKGSEGRQLPQIEPEGSSITFNDPHKFDHTQSYLYLCLKRLGLEDYY